MRLQGEYLSPVLPLMSACILRHKSSLRRDREFPGNLSRRVNAAWLARERHTSVEHRPCHLHASRQNARGRHVSPAGSTFCFADIQLLVQFDAEFALTFGRTPSMGRQGRADGKPQSVGGEMEIEIEKTVNEKAAAAERSPKRHPSRAMCEPVEESAKKSPELRSALGKWGTATYK